MIAKNTIIAAVVALLVIVSIFIVAGMQSQPVKSENSCSIDSDCACGVSLATGDCAYGNAAFINASKQCPDFCSGIAANLEIKCLNKVCVQQQTPDFACRTQGKAWNGTACACRADLCVINELALINGHIEAYCENNSCKQKTVCNDGYTMTASGCISINESLGQICTASGGIVKNGTACKSVDSYPNTCAIGSQGCSPDNSHSVLVCECPAEQCWNGNGCVARTMPQVL